MYTTGKIENPNALSNAAIVANNAVQQSHKSINFFGSLIGPFATVKAAKESTDDLRNEVERQIEVHREHAQLCALNSLKQDLLWVGIGTSCEECFASDKALRLAKDIALSVKCDDKHNERVIAEHASDKMGLQAIVCFLATALWAIICVMIGRNHPDVAAGISCLGFIPLVIGISIGTDWWCNNGW